MLQGTFDVTRRSHTVPSSVRIQRVLAIAWCASLLVGCTAITNPTLNGIPVRRLPTEMLTAPRREAALTIPLSMLRQSPSRGLSLGAR